MRPVVEISLIIIYVSVYMYLFVPTIHKSECYVVSTNKMCDVVCDLQNGISIYGIVDCGKSYYVVSNNDLDYEIMYISDIVELVGYGLAYYAIVRIIIAVFSAVRTRIVGTR